MNYADIIREINQVGGAVYAHDHVFHGRSGPVPPSSPERCEFSSLETLIIDASDRLIQIQKQHLDIPTVLYGFSLGGVIATSICLKGTAISLLVLESPCFVPHLSWFNKLALSVGSHVSPKFKIGRSRLRMGYSRLVFILEILVYII